MNHRRRVINRYRLFLNVLTEKLAEGICKGERAAPFASAALKRALTYFIQKVVSKNNKLYAFEWRSLRSREILFNMSRVAIPIFSCLFFHKLSRRYLSFSMQRDASPPGKCH
jgi:hypothetical protein